MLLIVYSTVISLGFCCEGTCIWEKIAFRCIHILVIAFGKFTVLIILISMGTNCIFTENRSVYLYQSMLNVFMTTERIIPVEIR